MGAQTTKAVLLDALGTLIRLEDPAPRLAAALGVPDQDAARAIGSEIAFYRANMHRGSDAAGLAEVRRGCADVVRAELGLAADRDVLPELLASIVFTAYEDSAPALRELRARGMRLVVVSNWDVSLHEALAATGLAPLLDGAVASAEVGAAKPDGVIFERALALAGAQAHEAVHVGDTPDADIAGARAAGIRAVLIDRTAEAGSLRPHYEAEASPVVRRIASLAELPALCP